MGYNLAEKGKIGKPIKMEHITWCPSLIVCQNLLSDLEQIRDN